MIQSSRVVLCARDIRDIKPPITVKVRVKVNKVSDIRDMNKPLPDILSYVRTAGNRVLKGILVLAWVVMHRGGYRGRGDAMLLFCSPARGDDEDSGQLMPEVNFLAYLCQTMLGWVLGRTS